MTAQELHQFMASVLRGRDQRTHKVAVSCVISDEVDIRACSHQELRCIQLAMATGIAQRGPTTSARLVDFSAMQNQEIDHSQVTCHCGAMQGRDYAPAKTIRAGATLEKCVNVGRAVHQAKGE